MRKTHSISKRIISFAMILTMLFSFAAVSLAAPGDTATNIKGYVVEIGGKNVYFAKADLARDAGVEASTGVESDLLKAYRSGSSTVAFVFDNDLYVDATTVSSAYALGMIGLGENPTTEQIAALIASVYAIDDSPFIVDTPIYKVNPNTGAIPAEPDVNVGAGGVEVSPEPKITVKSIEVRDVDSVLVTFSAAVDNTYINAANYELSSGNVVSAESFGDSAVLLAVDGLSYGDTFTLTVVSLGWTSGLNQIMEIEQKYAVKVTTSENTIEADGTTNMTVSAEIVEIETGEIVTEACQIQFVSSNGQLGQSIVSTQNGKATTTLKSDYSPSDIVTCLITAKVYSFDTHSELIGLSGNKTVYFTPGDVDPNVITTVRALAAGAYQADRFFVRFSDDIEVTVNNKADIRNSVRYVPYDPYAPNSRVPQRFAIDDVYNLTANILVFVLNTDMHNDWTGTVRNNIATRFDTTILDAAYLAINTTGPNYFRDNVTHGISFVDTDTFKGAVADGRNLIIRETAPEALDFILTDTTTPWLKGDITCDTVGTSVQLVTGQVKKWNHQDLVITFSEPMARDLVQGTITRGGYQINEHFAIDGKHLLVMDVGVYREDFIAGPVGNEAYRLAYNAAYNAAYPAAALYAALNNYIVVDYLYVGEYTDENNETREIVYITIAADNALATGNHSIQMANVGDWAGLTDSVQNTITTQTLQFHATRLIKEDSDPEDPFIVWAAFDAAQDFAGITTGEHDYLYVMFNEVMEAEGVDHGVDRTTNYTFNGNELPKGSQVTTGITGDWRSVTIRMPAGTWTGKAGVLGDYACVMGVSSKFVSAAGRALVSPTLPRSLYEFELSDWFGGAAADMDGLANVFNFEALYISFNIPEASVVLGEEGDVPDLTEGNGEITGLTIGNRYVVNSQRLFYAVLADGTLDADNPSTTLEGASVYAEAVAVTKITGLVNGYTYNVYNAKTGGVPDVTYTVYAERGVAPLFQTTLYVEIDGVETAAQAALWQVEYTGSIGTAQPLAWSDNAKAFRAFILDEGLTNDEYKENVDVSPVP